VLGSTGPEPMSTQAQANGHMTIPPPPEVISIGGRNSLLWSRPGRGQPPPAPARHPLLWVSAAFSGPQAIPQRRVGRLTTRPLKLLQRRLALGASPTTFEGTRLTNVPPPAPGSPAVIAVAGGRGGCGRTRLAIELATVLAGDGLGGRQRVLLVDADPGHPDVDLQLGVTDLESSRSAGARVDRILLQLPELADRRVTLDSMLWVEPRSGVRVALAPEFAADIGREQLDYLYTYFLAPDFDVIVVDAGPTCDPASAQLVASSGYWLSLASALMVPLRPNQSSVRAALETVQRLEAIGLPRSRCRLVMGVDRREGDQAAAVHKLLGDLVVVRWPWTPDRVERASRDQSSVAGRDDAFADRVAALLPELATARRRSH
jgi:flagellar biosynthesis protein FlhG